MRGRLDLHTRGPLTGEGMNLILNRTTGCERTACGSFSRLLPSPPPNKKWNRGSSRKLSLGQVCGQSAPRAGQFIVAGPVV